MSDPYKEWVWSPEGEDYYMYTWNGEKYVVIWSKKRDSEAEIVKPVLEDKPALESGEFPADTILDYPERGKYEPLDPSYVVQDKPRKFFKQGRVFSMLWTEALGSTTSNREADNISTVMYGDQAFSQIRRLVVVMEHRGFCYVCPISTYGGRGTGKRGLDPRTHSIIYTEGTRPTYVTGEVVALEKQAIPVVPAPATPSFSAASRINFAIYHPVQHNVKVKDLGCVRPDYIPLLVQYARSEDNWGGSMEQEETPAKKNRQPRGKETPAKKNHEPRGSTVDEEGAQAGHLLGSENEGTAPVDHDDANRGFVSAGDSVAPVSTVQAQSVEMTEFGRSDAHKNSSSHRDPVQSDSGCHSGIGTDTASICSIESIGSLADVSPSFLQEFVEFFGKMLMEKAGAYAWARYAVSIHSEDAIENYLGDLLKSYAIGLSHLATDSSAAGDGLEQRTVQEIARPASRLIRKYRPKIARIFSQRALAAPDSDISKFSHLQEYIQFSLQERIDLLNKLDGDFEDDEKSESDDDEDFLDLDAAREILISGEPFRQLTMSMRRAFYFDEKSRLSEIERCVRRELIGAMENNPDLSKPAVTGLRKAAISVEWDPIGFIKSQYSSVETPIANMLVLSGSALYAHGTTCADYLRMFWPSTCDIFLPVVQGAILDSKRTAKLDNGGHLNIEIPSTDSEDQSRRSVKVEIHGQEQLIVEISQQISWIAAVLRESPAGTRSVSYSCASLASDPHQQPGTAGFRISYKNQDLHPAEDACWFPFFENALIAYGFPIPERQAEVGLEIPIDILAALAGVKHAVRHEVRHEDRHEDFVLLKGFSFMLVPTGKVQDIVQWHLVRGNDESKGLSYEEPLSYEQALTLCEREPLLRETDLDSLREKRAIVGWCSSAQLLLGSESIDYRRIGYTDAQEASSRTRITSATLGFSHFATAQVNVAFGVKDGKFHWQGNNGPYNETVSRADDARVLLYDKTEKRAWLVPASYAILHIAQARLRTGFLGTADNNTANQAAQKTNIENELFHKEPSKCTSREALLADPERLLLNSDNYRFKDLFLDIWDVLDCLMAQKTPKGSDSGIDVRSMHDMLYGFEFIDIARKRFPMPLKSCPIERTSGGWTDLVQDIGALTILATGLEDLIKPTRDCIDLCYRWCSLPKGEDYLAVPVKLLKDLYYVAGCQLNYKYLTSNSRLQLERTSSILFAPCKSPTARPCICNRLCQVVGKSNMGTEPGDLDAHEEGAVIFGTSCSFLDKLKGKKHSRKENFYAQPNAHIDVPITPTAPSLPETSTSGSDSSFQRYESSEGATTESGLTSISDENLPVAKLQSVAAQNGAPSVGIMDVGISDSLPVRTAYSRASSGALENETGHRLQKRRKV